MIDVSLTDYLKNGGKAEKLGIIPNNMRYVDHKDKEFPLSYFEIKNDKLYQIKFYWQGQEQNFYAGSNLIKISVDLAAKYL